MAGYTERYNAILNFQVQGLQTLGAAAQQLDKLDKELGQLAGRASAAITRGGTGAEADLRRTFARNEQAAQSFVTGLDNGARRTNAVFGNMDKQARDLAASVERLATLQRTVAQGVALPTRATPALNRENELLRQAGLVGSLQRNAAGGFYGITPGGGTTDTFSSRQAAVKRLIESEVLGLRTQIARLIGEVSGVITGAQSLLPLQAPAPGPTQRVLSPETREVLRAGAVAPTPVTIPEPQSALERAQRAHLAKQLVFADSMEAAAAATQQQAGEARQVLSSAERLKAAQDRYAARLAAAAGAGGVAGGGAGVLGAGVPGRGGPSVPGLAIYPVEAKSLNPFLEDAEGNRLPVTVGGRAEYGPGSDEERLLLDSVERRKELELRREAVTQEALSIQQRALQRLQEAEKPVGPIVGGVRQFSPAQVEKAYLDELIARRPVLTSFGEFGDVFGEVAGETRKLGQNITKTERGLELWREHIHAQLENDRRLYGYSTSGPLGQRFGGFATDFAQGFRGRRELPYAEQLGQVSKFSLLYGSAYAALYGLGQAFQAAIQNAIEYNAAIRELSIATGQSTDEVHGLAESLGDIASGVGFAPSEGILAGARGVGIFGAYDSGPVQQSAISQQFTEASTQLAFVTNRTLEQVGQDLGAIAQSFDLEPSQLGYVQDLDAYFSKVFGSTAGGTLETTAQIGSLGAEAGFSIEEVQAFASVLQSRTGQTPAATAGFLSQVFGRSGDPALRQKFAELGIDIAQPFRDQIEQLSELLAAGTLGEGLKNEIINAFGRGRSGQAASIITEEFANVTRSVERAREGEAAGAAQSQFEQRMDSVSGRLRQLAGDLLELGKNIGETGLLDVFGLLVFAFDELIQVTNNAVEAIQFILTPLNALPDPLRVLAISAAAAALALRTNLGKAALGSILLAGQTPRGIAAAQALGYGLATDSETRRTYVAPGGVPSTLNRGAGLRSVGSGLAAGAGALLANPITYAIAGLVAIGEVRGQMQSFRDALNQATAALTPAFTTDPEQLRLQAEAADKEAVQLDDAQGILLNTFTLGDAERTADRYVANLRAQADMLERMADEEEAYFQQASRPVGGTTPGGVSTTVFGTRTVEDFATGLQTLQAQGYNATQQFNALTAALRETGSSAALAEAELALLPGRIRRAFDAATGELTFDDLGLEREGILGSVGKLNQLSSYTSFSDAQRIGTAYDPADLSQSLNENLAASGFEEGLQKLIKGGLTQEELEKYITEVVNGFDLSVIGDDVQSTEEQEALKQKLIEYYTTVFENYVDAIDPTKALNGAEFQSLLTNTLQPTLEANLASLSTIGYDEGTRRYEATLQKYLDGLSALDFKGQPPGAYFREVRVVEARIASSAIVRLEGAREVAQQYAKSDAEFRRIGRSYLRRELETALGARSLALVKDVISRSSDNVVDSMRAAIRLDLAQAQTSLAAARKVIEYVKVGRRLIRASSQATFKAYRAAAKEVDRLRQELNLLTQAAKTTLPDASALTPPEDLEPEPEEPTDTPAQIAAARALAEATRRGGGIAVATAQIQVARADLAAAEEGTVAYYQALQSLYEAQRSLSEAIRQYKVDKFLLGGDITDPVFQARAEAKAARQQLRYDQRQGASPDQIAADRLDVRRAEAAVDQAKFSQWLSDLQTAEQLERISHEQYVRMLERRAERLKDIKNRTRQEQDQLDQVLLALKEAQKTTASQFNLGDIRVPTPYEVRRYIELQKAAALKGAQGYEVVPYSGNGDRDNRGLKNEIRINIDGADTAQIRRVLYDILGGGAIKTTSTKTGKR